MYCTLKGIWRKICSFLISLYSCLKEVFHRIKPRKKAGPLLPLENPTPKATDRHPLKQALLISNSNADSQCQNIHVFSGQCLEQKQKYPSQVKNIVDSVTIYIPNFSDRHALDYSASSSTHTDSTTIIQENAPKKNESCAAEHEESGICISTENKREESSEEKEIKGKKVIHSTMVVKKEIEGKKVIQSTMAVKKEIEGKKVIQSNVAVKKEIEGKKVIQSTVAVKKEIEGKKVIQSNVAVKKEIEGKKVIQSNVAVKKEIEGKKVIQSYVAVKKEIEGKKKIQSTLKVKKEIEGKNVIQSYVAVKKEIEGKKVIQSSVAVKKPRWIRHYNSDHRILLVGEGDFSFSCSLSMTFGCASKMIATSLDSQEFLMKNYAKAPWNIGELKKRGCIVMHGIDATTIATQQQLQQHKTFDRIIYNFPFAGFFKGLSRDSTLRLHRRLVSLFLKNAKEMIDENGEIHISHKTNGYHNEWYLMSIASSHGLRLIEEVEFDLSDYPGYNTKRGFGGDENFDCYPSNTFKFGLKFVRYA